MSDTSDARANSARPSRSHRGWTLKEMSERSGIPVSTLSKVEHDRLTLTYDKLLQLSQKLNIRDVRAVRRERAAGRRRHRAPEHRPAGRCRPGHDAQLRLLLSVHRASPEADDADHHPHPRQVARASSATSSVIRARNISTCSRAASWSTPNSTIRSSLRGRRRSTSIRTWATPMSPPKAATRRCVLGICSSADESLMSSLMTIHEPTLAHDRTEIPPPAPFRVRRLRRTAA